jgi:hypothetical protein
MRLQGLVLFLGLLVTAVLGISKLHLLWITLAGFVLPILGAALLNSGTARRFRTLSNESKRSGLPFTELLRRERSKARRVWLRNASVSPTPHIIQKAYRLLAFRPSIRSRSKTFFSAKLSMYGGNVLSRELNPYLTCHHSVAYKSGIGGIALVTSDEIEQMAKNIWPLASSIAVTQSKARHIPGIGSEPDGYNLAISTDGDLVALVSARSLDGIKTKLEQRSKKKRWGSFDWSPRFPTFYLTSFPIEWYVSGHMTSVATHLWMPGS